jgi:DeoR family transcriptional regulator, aga operon transcriptional repressor
MPFSLRQQTNREAKARIAELAATLLKPGETICLDAGTTVEELATYVGAMPKLTVVTPAIALASSLCRFDQLEVLAIGGRLDPQTMSCAGPMTEFQISEVPVHKVFLGAHGIDGDGDVVELSLEIARLKRAMTKVSREVILLADSSKWNTAGVAKVTDISAMDVVVSDEGLSEESREMLADRGVQLLLAAR